MTCAYSELYLENARRVLAVMLDYAVNSLDIDGDVFFQMFTKHAVRKLFFERKKIFFRKRTHFFFVNNPVYPIEE